MSFSKADAKGTGTPTFSAANLSAALSRLLEWIACKTPSGICTKENTIKNTKNPNGKLRLLYEANPLAFIVEQAGGRASSGSQRILDIVPLNLHQKTPLFIGSEEDVLEAEKYLEQEIS